MISEASAPSSVLLTDLYQPVRVSQAVRERAEEIDRIRLQSESQAGARAYAI
jgi:hypothetical protein